MLFYIIKIALTTLLIVAISELAKRNTFIAAFTASLPTISILAILWLYIDTRDVTRASELTTGILWLVLPSLVFFVALPVMLKHGLNFYASMLAAISLTAGSYWLMITVLDRFGIKI